MSRIFNPQRMEIARARRMLTRRQLALKINVRPCTLMQWVKCLAEPTDTEVTAIAQALEWPKEFFFGHEIDTPESISSFP